MAFARCRRASSSTATGISPRWRSALAPGTTAPRTAWSRGFWRNDGRVARRRRRLQRGALLVPVAVRAAAVSVLRLVHLGSLARCPAPRADSRARLRAGRLARLHRARGVVQRREPVLTRLSCVDPPHRGRPHRDLRPLHRRAPEDRILWALAAVAASGKAGWLPGLSRGRYHVRDRLDSVRGPDPGRDPVPRGHGRDGPARHRPPGRVLRRARATVPDLGGGPRAVPRVLQALPPLHPGGRARGGSRPRRRWRSRLDGLVRRSELVGGLAHPGLAPQAAVAACAFTSAFPRRQRTSARASTRSGSRSPCTTRSSPRNA